MFTVPYPSIPERKAYETRARRMRGAVVAGLIRDFARWVSVASR